MKPPAKNNTNIIALDVGERRIGVARANTVAKLPSPLKTLVNDEQIFDNIGKLVLQENAEVVIVGLPRGLNGQETAQTETTRDFCNRLKEQLSIPVYLQDEALTSVKAKQELALRHGYRDKGMVDALAAVYILEDFLAHNNRTGEVRRG